MPENFKDLVYPKPSEFIETFNSGHADRPFNGAWGDVEWPKPLSGLRPTKKDRKRYQVGARIEPVGDLIEFAYAFTKALRTNLDSLPRKEDKSMFVCYDVTGKDVQQAMNIASYRIGKAVRKTKLPVVRLSFDIREVETHV